MMNVFKNLPARFLFCAATSVAAFGCSDNESEQATCTTVSVQSQEYCVYRGQNILVETGYDCPSGMMQRHEIDQTMIVCSNSQTPPVQDVIEELETLVPYGTLDPDPNNTTQPTACEMAKSSLESTLASVDTSCQTDADCTNTGNYCSYALSACGYAVSSAQAQGIDQAIRQYEASQCNDTVCNPCPTESEGAQAVCINNTCEIPLDPVDQCEAIEQSYQQAVASVTNTCQTDADCNLVISACGIDTGNDCYIVGDSDLSGVGTLAQEYLDNDCNVDENGIPAVCGCPAGTVSCVNNVCVGLSAN